MAASAATAGRRPSGSPTRRRRGSAPTPWSPRSSARATARSAEVSAGREPIAPCRPLIVRSGAAEHVRGEGVMKGETRSLDSAARPAAVRHRLPTPRARAPRISLALGLVCLTIPGDMARAGVDTPPTRKTEGAIRGDGFLINGRPTYEG